MKGVRKSNWKTLKITFFKIRSQQSRGRSDRVINMDERAKWGGSPVFLHPPTCGNDIILTFIFYAAHFLLNTTGHYGFTASPVCVCFVPLLRLFLFRFYCTQSGFYSTDITRKMITRFWEHFWGESLFSSVKLLCSLI